MFVLHIRGSGGINSVMVKKKPLNCVPFCYFQKSSVVNVCFLVVRHTARSSSTLMTSQLRRRLSQTPSTLTSSLKRSVATHPSHKGYVIQAISGEELRTVWSAKDPAGIFSDTTRCNMILDYEGNVPLVGCICCFKEKTIVLNI